MALTLGLVTACFVLAAGCAGRQEAPQTAAPSKPQATPNRAPAAPGVIVIVTDQTGTLLGAVFLPNPVSDPITINRSPTSSPRKSIEEVAPEKVFLTPGFQCRHDLRDGGSLPVHHPGEKEGHPGASLQVTCEPGA